MPHKFSALFISVCDSIQFWMLFGKSKILTLTTINVSDRSGPRIIPCGTPGLTKTSKKLKQNKSRQAMNEKANLQGICLGVVIQTFNVGTN